MTDQPNSVYHDYMKREEKGGPIYIRNTGRQECRAGFGWGPGVRDHFRLYHVTAGKGVFTCGDRRWELQAGDTFLIYPHEKVSCYADDREPWSYVWAGFGGQGAADCIRQTVFSVTDPVHCGDSGQEICRMLLDIDANYGIAPWQKLAALASLYALLAFLVRSGDSGQDPRANIRDCAQIAADYIATHCEEPITVEWLAEYTSVSHSSLYRRFVEMFGVSPKRFLLEYRVERASRMLLSTDLSVQEISNSVGFDDPFYFSRAFKEIKGMSPRQYANANRAM